MTKALTAQLRTFFKTHPVKKAWVFGSFSRGEECPDSDVDIMVKLDKTVKLSLLAF